MKKRSFVSVVLGLLFAAALILMPAAKVSAEDLPEAVKYVDVTVGENGVLSTETKTIEGDKYTIISDQTSWGTTGTTTWYVVNNSEVTINGRITVTGDVRLILRDGCELKAPKGITVSGEANSLTIYGQTEGSGKLTIDSVDDHNAGIGGFVDSNDKSAVNGSNITFNGGTVAVKGGISAAGIGGGKQGNGSNITINGGKVTATGGTNGAGIGGGYGNGGGGVGSDITINGGTVIATGGGYGSGIGGGIYKAGKNITINGGEVTATGGSKGAGIGGGQTGAGSNITINGGNVKASGGEGGAGIGGGDVQNGSNITINGGTVAATGGSRGAGIGGGCSNGESNSGAGIEITINGGNVTAVGGTDSAGKTGDGIGGGYEGTGSDIRINNCKIGIKIDGIITIFSKLNATEKELAEKQYILTTAIPYTSKIDSLQLIEGQANAAVEIGTLSVASVTTCKFDIYSDETCKTKVSQSGITVAADDNGKVSVYSDATVGKKIYYVGFTDDINSSYMIEIGEVKVVSRLTAEDFSVNKDTYTFNGNEQKPTMECEETAAVVEYAIFDQATGEATESPVNAGTYVIYASVKAENLFEGNEITYAADGITYVSGGISLGSFTIEKATPDAPTGLVCVKTSWLGESDGKITGTTAAMEYSKTEDFTSAIACADTEVTGLAAGTYYVRIKGTENTNASACVEVTVAEGDKKIFEGITVIGFSGVYDGKAHGITISGVPDGATVKYGTVEGSCDSDSITFTDFTNGAKTVYVKVSKENYNDWTDNATVTIAKSTPEAPSRLTGVKPSEFGKSDGKITGTTAAMEYSKTEDFKSAVECAGTAVTGLAAGTYYVRIKETANTNASACVEVTVDEGDKKADPTPIPTPIPTPAPEPVIIITPQETQESQGTSETQETAESQGSSETQGTADSQDTSETQGAADSQGSSEPQGTTDSQGSSETQGTAESADTPGAEDGKTSETEKDEEDGRTSETEEGEGPATVETVKSDLAEVFTENKVAVTEQEIESAVPATKKDSAYYDKSGKKITNSFVETSDGNLRYVGTTGKSVKKAVVATVDAATGDMKMYYAGKNGVIVKDKVVTLPDGGKIFASKDGALATNEIVTSGKHQYYADENGKLLTNRIIKTEDGTRYYANKYGRIRKNALFTAPDGDKRYATADGTLAKSCWVTVGDKMYWCNKIGRITKSKPVEND